MRALCVLLFLATGLLMASRPAQADACPPVPADLREEVVLSAHYLWGTAAPMPELVAQVCQESHWRANAHSGVGAQGLGQIMPGTWVWLLRTYPQIKAGDGDAVPKATGPISPYSPVLALRGLVAYDHYLFVQTHAADACQHMAFALSAYNGGLGWVYRDAALAQRHGASPLVWFGSVERFNAGRSAASIKENRDYPRRVLGPYAVQYAAMGWGAPVCSPEVLHG